MIAIEHHSGWAIARSGEPISSLKLWSYINEESQLEMAEATGIGQSCLSRWWRKGKPRADNPAKVLADYTGMHIETVTAPPSKMWILVYPDNTTRVHVETVTVPLIRFLLMRGIDIEFH